MDNLPDGIAVFACLAVEEAEFFQAFGKGVFGRHCRRRYGISRRGRGRFNSSSRSRRIYARLNVLPEVALGISWHHISPLRYAGNISKAPLQHNGSQLRKVTTPSPLPPHHDERDYLCATPTMSSRFGLRFGAALRQNLQTQTRFTAQKRYQSVASTAAPAEANQSAFAKLWNSEVGPKTVHFWAPIMKVSSNQTEQCSLPLNKADILCFHQWGVVLAGASDFFRPASSLSLSQNLALMATGSIWTRWCFVIKPRNLFLASVNFALFCVGSAQVFRVLQYQRSLPEAEKAATELGKLERVVEHPEKIVGAVKGEKV